MKTLGIALVALGIVALAYGVIGYNQRTTLFEVGGIKATATEHKSFPVAPIAGGLALLGGIALLVAPRMRRP